MVGGQRRLVSRELRESRPRPLPQPAREAQPQRRGSCGARPPAPRVCWTARTIRGRPAPPPHCAEGVRQPERASDLPTHLSSQNSGRNQVQLRSFTSLHYFVELKLPPLWQWQDVRGQLPLCSVHSTELCFSKNDNNIIFLQTSNHVKKNRDLSLTHVFEMRGIERASWAFKLLFWYLWWSSLWEWYFAHRHHWRRPQFCEVRGPVFLYGGSIQLWGLIKVSEIVSSGGRILRPAVSF